MKKPPPKQGLKLDLLARGVNGETGCRHKNCRRGFHTVRLVFDRLFERLLVQ